MKIVFVLSGNSKNEDFKGGNIASMESQVWSISNELASALEKYHDIRKIAETASKIYEDILRI